MINVRRVWRPSLRSNGSRAFASLTTFAVKPHGAIWRPIRKSREPTSEIHCFIPRSIEQIPLSLPRTGIRHSRGRDERDRGIIHS